MEKYLTVTALTKYIKRKLDIDPHLRSVWLKGEISNFKHHSRGHMYMTIKDDHARIQAVMFAGNNRYLKFTPENGMHVLIHGDISVFEASGQYQIYIQRMEPDGFGSLYMAFEQLKKKLSLRGFFADDHKKKIPVFPNRIGVITSPTGAAIRDIITTIKRRYPVAEITIIPALVQGVHAGNDIARAVRLANERNHFDVLIVGRGGGSIEELWGFNEQIVAEAIYESHIPIISAVGHETDITISDYVADMRAPTPTGAAELAVPSIVDVMATIDARKRSLQQSMEHILTNEDRHLNRLMRSYAFRYPEQLLRQKEQELDKLSERFRKNAQAITAKESEKLTQLKIRLLSLHPRKQFTQASKDSTFLTKRLYQVMETRLKQKNATLHTLIEKLTLLNPLETMRRGFSITYTKEGNILKEKKDVKMDDRITVKISDARLDCRVMDIRED